MPSAPIPMRGAPRGGGGRSGDGRKEFERGAPFAIGSLIDDSLNLCISPPSEPESSSPIPDGAALRSRKDSF